MGPNLVPLFEAFDQTRLESCFDMETGFVKS